MRAVRRTRVKRAVRRADAASVSESRRNRRRHRRVARRISVLVESGGRYFQGSIKNLSKYGVFVRSSVLPEPGAEVHLKFETIEGSKIEVTGTVRWTTAGLPRDDAQSGFGVLLESPTEAYLSFFSSLAERE